MRSCPQIFGIVVLCLASALIGDLSAQRIAIRVEVDSKSVPLGGGFTVQVTRTWPKDFSASTWQDDSLDLGMIDLLFVDVNIVKDQKVEVRRFRCFAFQLNSIEIPRTSFTAIDPSTGEKLSTESEVVLLTVASVLPKNDVGGAELPRGLWPMESREWPSAYVIIGFPLLFIAILVFMKKRRARNKGAPLGPHAQAELRLATITADSCNLGSFVDEFAELVRDYVAEQFQVPAREMTTAELTRRMADISLLTDQELASLRHFLQRLDEIRYGDQAIAAEERRQMTDAFTTWLRSMARWQGEQDVLSQVSVT